MDFSLTDEQRMLRDGVERYVHDEYDFHQVVRPLKANEPGYSEACWKQYAELGWLALALPEDVGGLDCSFIEVALVAEAFGHGLVLEPYIASVVLGAFLVDRSGNAAQRQAVLPDLANGRLKLALAHQEPGRGHTVDRIDGTRAIADRDGWTLTGLKTMAWQAPSADRLIVSAVVGASEDTKALALFVVDPKSAGVRLDSYALIDGSRAADVYLTQVRLPPEALLAGPERGAALLDEALDRTNLALTAEALGAMEAVLSITSEYLKTRKQFGQPLGKFQALQHRMAEMFVETQEARSILYRGLAHLDAEPAARRAAISTAKVVVAAASRFVGAQGIQLHGGYGVTDEYQVSHYYKKLLCYEKLFGDSDYHLDRAAGLVD